MKNEITLPYKWELKNEIDLLPERNKKIIDRYKKDRTHVLPMHLSMTLSTSVLARISR
jgi:hypothetical protein